jgi:hypothetical protein
MSEFAYNNHIHSSTQQTPFFLDTGRHPRMGFEPVRPSTTSESANQFRERMEHSLAEAKAALAKAKEEYTLYYNRRRTPAPELKVGDLVFIDASDIRTTRPSKKLDHLRYGPYPIEAKVGKSAYRLTLPDSMRRLHPVFPIVKLTPAPSDPIEGRRRNPPPAPDVIDGHEEHEVEEVLSSKIRYGDVWYKVRWKGWGIQYDSWIPHRNTQNCLDKVRAFHRKYPDQVCHINSAMLKLSPPAFHSLPFRDISSVSNCLPICGPAIQPLPAWRRTMRLRSSLARRVFEP